MNIIPNGTEVLIFKYFRERGPYQDDENYIYGIIKSSKTSDDLSYHVTSWYEQIYEVLGEDGKRYVGTYGRGLIGNSFIMTKEDYIKGNINTISYVEKSTKKNKDDSILSRLFK